MVSLGIATGFERRYLVLKRLGTTPLGPGGLVAAKTAAVLALEVLQVAVVVGVALALGWDPAGSVTRVVGVAGVLALGTTAFAGLGLLMAGTLRAEATLALTNGLYVAFILVGGIAVPLDRLPGWLEGLSRGLPAAQLAAALRGVMTAGEAVPGWARGAARRSVGVPVGGVSRSSVPVYKGGRAQSCARMSTSAATAPNSRAR